MKAIALVAVLSASPHSLNRDAVARLLQLPLTERHAGNPERLEGLPVPTTLSVQLLGTLVDTTQTMCAALVREATATRTLFVGSSVQHGTVVMIARDEVIIDHDGVLESLRSHAVPGTPPTASPTPASTGAVTRLPTGQFRVSMKDPTAWMSARVVPTKDGLKIFGVQDGSPYTQLGVRNGDVLRRVNGQPVDFNVLQQIHPGAQLTVDLDRDGQAFSLSGSIE